MMMQSSVRSVAARTLRTTAQRNASTITAIKGREVRAPLRAAPAAVPGRLFGRPVG